MKVLLELFIERSISFDILFYISIGLLAKVYFTRTINMQMSLVILRSTNYTTNTCRWHKN